MSQSSSSFPEFAKAQTTEHIRAHFLGAAACWNAAHEALLIADHRRAFEEMEKCLDLVITSRKLHLEVYQPASAPTPEAEKSRASEASFTR